jgi:competence protein ComFC
MSGTLGRRLVYQLYRSFWTAVDWVYPPNCAGCQAFGEIWCPRCQQSVERLSTHICSICSDFLPSGSICEQCQISPPSYTALRCYGRYTGALREAIHRLKYKHDLGLAEALSRHLIELFTTLNWQVDLLTAIPLSRERLAERGFNQSSLLARPLGLAASIHFVPGILERIRVTRPQVGLSAKERRENVRNAFAAQSSKVKGKVVLVVDDVSTTGATIQSAATALMVAGAKEVYAMTVARTFIEENSTGVLESQPDLA